MDQRDYLSNIATAWPLDRQRETLGEQDRAYVDELRPAALKRRDQADLERLAELLRPASRRTPETVRVASFDVLAWTWQDFADVIAAAHRRNATLRALDTGAEIPPDATPDVVAEAIQAFARATRSRGLVKSRPEIAAERKADTLRRIGIIRPFWHLRQPATRELLAMAGSPKHPMAPGTAKAHLGSRPKVQADYEREQASEPGRAAGRTRRKEQAT